jgi:hypothetical protein
MPAAVLARGGQAIMEERADGEPQVTAQADAFPKSLIQKTLLAAPFALAALAMTVVGESAIEHAARKVGHGVWQVPLFMGLLLTAAPLIGVFAFVCRRDSGRALPFVAAQVGVWILAAFSARFLA